MCRVVRSLPPSLRVRANAWLQARDGSLGPELTHLYRYQPTDRRNVALDIGANNGSSTLLLSRIFKDVYAFEPNRDLLSQWATVAPRNVSTFPFALSSTNTSAKLVIPIFKGVALEGWASLDAPLLSDYDGVQELDADCRTLDSLNLSGAVDFINIDVEGHELAVLEGGRRLIERCRPWMVIESVQERRAKVESFFAELEYVSLDATEILGIASPVRDLIMKPTN
jgi:FkbM family methyltransferase